jgi:hypothetical protein
MLMTGKSCSIVRPGDRSQKIGAIRDRSVLVSTGYRYRLTVASIAPRTAFYALDCTTLSASSTNVLQSLQSMSPMPVSVAYTSNIRATGETILIPKSRSLVVSMKWRKRN